MGGILNFRWHFQLKVRLDLKFVDFENLAVINMALIWNLIWKDHIQKTVFFILKVKGQVHEEWKFFIINPSG